MKKKFPVIFILALLFMLPQITDASWVYLTVEELVEKSDVILIGEVSGRVNGSIKTAEVTYNKWQVKPYYYIKGDIRASEIIVGTPDDKTSLHYDLNDHGNTVVLFLRKDGNYYMPHSPQAVVGVEVANDRLKAGEDLSGEELVELIKIKVQSMEDEEREKLVSYLTSKEQIYRPIPVEENNNVLSIVGGASIVGAVLGVLFMMRKKIG